MYQRKLNGFNLLFISYTLWFYSDKVQSVLTVGLFPVCVTELWAFRRSLTLHKHCETRSCAGRIDGHFRTVGLSLKFHSAFVVHSKGREDKQVHMYKEIIPGPRGRTLLKHRAESLWKLFGSGIEAALDFVTLSVLQPNGSFFSLLLAAQQVSKGESCRYRQRTASWLCISRCLDTSGTFTRGQFRTPTPLKTCPVLRGAKVPTLSARVHAPLPPVAWDTNHPRTPCR